MTLSRCALVLCSPAAPRSWTGNTAGAPSRPSRRPSPSGTTELSGLRHSHTPADSGLPCRAPTPPSPPLGRVLAPLFPPPMLCSQSPIPAPVRVPSVPSPPLTSPSRVLRPPCPVLPAVPTAAPAPFPCEPPASNPDPVPPPKSRQVPALPGPEQPRPQRGPGQHGPPQVPSKALSVHPQPHPSPVPARPHLLGPVQRHLLRRHRAPTKMAAADFRCPAHTCSA